MEFNISIQGFKKMLDESTPTRYWEYKSIVDVVLSRIEYSKIGYKDYYFTKETNKDKIELLKSFKNLCKKSGIFNTNKIVVEIETADKEKYNIGWYDGSLTIGHGRRGDSWIKAVEC